MNVMVTRILYAEISFLMLKKRRKLSNKRDEALEVRIEAPAVWNAQMM